MSEQAKSQKARFSKALSSLHNHLSKLDERVESIASSATQIEEVFENYGGIAKGICSFLNAENFNIYAKSSPASPNLGGILSVQGANGTLALQYIKTPIDSLTTAGHAYSTTKTINIADIHHLDDQYPDLDPKRVIEIDKHLKRATKQSLATPVLDPEDQTVIAVIEITNNLGKEEFSEAVEQEFEKVARIMAESISSGFISLVFPIMISSEKKSYVTTIPHVLDEEVESLDQKDFIAEKTKKKVTRKKETTKTVVEDNETEESEEEFEEESDDEQTVIQSEEDDGSDEAPEYDVVDENDEFDEVEEDEADENQEKSNDPEDLINSLRATQAPNQKEIPYTPDDNTYKNIYDYLVTFDKVNDRDLHQTVLMAETEERPVEPYLIVRHGFTLEEIGTSLSKFYRAPYSPFDPTLPKPEELVKKLKPDYMQRLRFLPVDKFQDGSIKIICTNPTALEKDGTLRQIYVGEKYKLHVTSELEFQFTFQLFFGEDSSEKLNEMLSTLSDQYGQGESDEFDVDSAEKGVSDNELVLLVNKIITDAYKRGVSDIHIEPYPGKAKTRIRFRIDGSMMEYLVLPSTLKDAIITRIKVMSNLDISDRRRPQDGKIAMRKFSPLKIELRVATIPTAGGLEDAVMRILASGEPLPLEKLGILPQNEERLIPLIEKPYGILFVCGPTGSGKTTTLHSILKHLNTVETKIWTAEDPVEITQAGLRQVQVNRKAGMEFSTAMRAFLRADPDIIMVGEMRDHETVSTGIEASLTGHLVMSTLHTNSAPEAIVRLLDMGMDPFNFSDALLGILAQRLAKKLCDCKEAYEADEEEIELLAQEYSFELQKTPDWTKDPKGELAKLIKEWKDRYAKNGKITLQEAKGCSLCNSGYRGRIGLHELLVGSDRTKRLIQQKSSVEDLVAACLEEGMLTLKMDGIHKVLMGITDIKQVRSVCVK